MTEYIRTECPNCHTQYKVSLSKVADGKHNAKCKKCKTIFIISENLATQNDVVKASTSTVNPTKTNSERTASTRTSSSNTTHSNSHDVSKSTVVSSDHNDNYNDLDEKNELIHDDMFIEDEASDAIGNDFDSDSLNFDDVEFGDEWSSFSDADDLARLNKSNAFDSIDSPDNPTDESWLNDLLTDANADETLETYGQPEAEESLIEPNTNSNLSSLLDDLGVPSAEPSIPNKEDSRVLMHERLQRQSKNSNSSKFSVLTLFFWLLGCFALLMLLLAQYAVFNLDALLKNPTQRNYLEKFCTVVNCALPQADITSLKITNQRVSSSNITANSTDIMAAITNVSNQEQLFPNLKVTVYTGNNVAGEFIAMPEDYLVTPQRIIGSSQSTIFLLTVKIDSNKVTTVKITPFY